MTKLAPRPKGSPFMGHASGFSADPLGYIVNLQRTYGDIVNMPIGPINVFLVSQPDYIREVLITKAALFPKSERDRDIMGRFLGQGLVTSEGDFHKKQRQLAQPAFHMQRIGAYADTMVDFADRMADDWADGEVVDMNAAMIEVTMNIVSKTLFNANVSDASHRVGAAVHTLQTIANATYRRVVTWPTWLPTPENRRHRAATAVLNETVAGIIDERRAAGDDHVADTGDLLSMLLLARDEDGRPMSPEQLRDEAVTLFVAGHETTSNALTWTWYLLSQHPDVAARLHEEVDGVLNGRLPTMADLPQLPYTEQVIKESMRLLPPVWILNARRAMEATTIGGYAIPTGAHIFIAPYVIHRRPECFPDPERFDPERFTPENEARLPRYGYLPFGAGHRVCIGNTFAMMEARLLLATFAQRYTMTLEPDQVVEPNPLITMSPRFGLRLRLHARTPEQIAAEPMAAPVAVP